MGRWTRAGCVHILYQVCKSLDEAHRAGLVHRDIKPSNILLCKLGLEYDFAKVLDFGLVKSLASGAQTESMMTVDGVTTGTPAYLSPEMALGNREIDGRADLYSLGCVAYFLLTGRMVFEESSPTAFAIAHVQKPPVPMSQRSELPIPAGLEAIVMQLLEKDPAKRIQSAQEAGTPSAGAAGCAGMVSGPRGAVVGNQCSGPACAGAAPARRCGCSRR